MQKNDNMFIYIQTLYKLSFIKRFKGYYIFNQCCTSNWTCQCYHDMCLHFRLLSPVPYTLLHHYVMLTEVQVTDVHLHKEIHT